MSLRHYKHSDRIDHGAFFALIVMNNVCILQSLSWLFAQEVK